MEGLGFVSYLGNIALVVLLLLDYWIPKTEHCTSHCQSPSKATSFPCAVDAELRLPKIQPLDLIVAPAVSQGALRHSFPASKHWRERSDEVKMAVVSRLTTSKLEGPLVRSCSTVKWLTCTLPKQG